MKLLKRLYCLLFNHDMRRVDKESKTFWHQGVTINVFRCKMCGKTIEEPLLGDE